MLKGNPEVRIISYKQILCQVKMFNNNLVKPQLHCHDFGHDGATTHPDLSSRDASAWVVAAP